jgi:hypothetical protein
MMQRLHLAADAVVESVIAIRVHEAVAQPASRAYLRYWCVNTRQFT